MNGHQAIGGANHLHLARPRKAVRAVEGFAAKAGVASADLGPIEHVQDAVVVDSPVQVGAAPAAHATALNTGTASQVTSANLVYQAAE